LCLPPLLLLLLPAIGTVNFTGDMPVILMVDGPSLGGFVCAATIVSTELWKIGQVRTRHHQLHLCRDKTREAEHGKAQQPAQQV
jgi:allophanate hydrolase subunit 2